MCVTFIYIIKQFLRFYVMLYRKQNNVYIVNTTILH